MRYKKIKHAISILKNYKKRTSLLLIGICVSSMAISFTLIFQNNFFSKDIIDINKFDSHSIYMEGSFDNEMLDLLSSFDKNLKLAPYAISSDKKIDNTDHNITVDIFSVYSNFHELQIPSAIDDDYLVTTKLKAGRTFTEEDNFFKRDLLIISEVYAKYLFNNVPALNKFISIDDKTYQIIGILESTQDTKLNLKQNIDNLNIQVFTNNYKDQEYTSIIGLTSHIVNSTYEDNLEKYLSANHSSFYQIYTKNIHNNFYLRFIKSFDLTLNFILLVLLIISMLFLSTIVIFFMKERVPEFGLKRAIGVSNKDLSAQVVTEMIILGLIGGFIGMVIGNVVGITYFLTRNFSDGVYFINLPVSIFLIPILLSLLETILVSTIPCLRISKISVLDCLKYE